MHIIRCPVCNKKLAESGRPPVSGMLHKKNCKTCGKEVKGRIITDHVTDEIKAHLKCPCGWTKDKVLSHMVTVKCRRCKTITKF